MSFPVPRLVVPFCSLKSNCSVTSYRDSGSCVVGTSLSMLLVGLVETSKVFSDHMKIRLKIHHRWGTHLFFFRVWCLAECRAQERY